MGETRLGYPGGHVTGPGRRLLAEAGHAVPGGGAPGPLIEVEAGPGRRPWGPEDEDDVRTYDMMQRRVYFQWGIDAPVRTALVHSDALEGLEPGGQREAEAVAEASARGDEVVLHPAGVPDLANRAAVGGHELRWAVVDPEEDELFISVTRSELVSRDRTYLVQITRADLERAALNAQGAALHSGCSFSEVLEAILDAAGEGDPVCPVTLLIEEEEVEEASYEFELLEDPEDAPRGGPLPGPLLGDATDEELAEEILRRRKAARTARDPARGAAP